MTKRSRNGTAIRSTAGRAVRAGLLAVGIVICATATAQAQGNPPQSCPADPVAAMSALQLQIDALYANVQVQAKSAQADLKATTDPGQLTLKIAYYEELLFQYETQAQLLYEQVREINRCCFRSGKYLLWVEIERVTQVWQKVYYKLIKITIKYFKVFYRYKLLKIVNTSTIGCCLCNGVPNPAITNCASAPGLTQPQCSTACLPFSSNGGQWFFQQMCDAGTGTCVPDP
jgi:hypothetical protein